jgi:hypothetical protein
MRTSIYVYVTSNFSISTAEDELTLVSMEVATPNTAAVETVVCQLARTNERQLTPGVYLVRSTLPVTVLGQSETYFDHVAMSDDKSKWPEPSLQVMALVPNAATSSFEPFFNGGKGVDDGFMAGRAVSPPPSQQDLAR